MVKLLFFCFRVTNSMGPLSFSHFRVTNVKLINEKKSLNITVSKWHGLRLSITLFVFSLLCCKYICDIYLSMLDFNGLCKFNNSLYLQNCRGDLVSVSYRRNDHMQVYMVIIEGKLNFFMWNVLTVDRLTGSRLISLWNTWGWR